MAKKIEKPEQEVIKINLENKIVILKVENFETDIDMDDILKIDYSNILGEVLTFPVIMNRIGILRAELQNTLSTEEFDLKVYAAKLGEMFRKNLSKSETDAGGNKKVKQPTVQQLENEVLLAAGYILRQKKVFRIRKEWEFVDSLYWAAKEKSKKLDYCSGSIKPEDFEHEIMEGAINGVMIKVRDKLIK